MITIKNVRTLDGQTIDHTLPSSDTSIIEAKAKLLLVPGLIDSHICFGSSAKASQKWQDALKRALAGGITCAIEIPDSQTPCTNKAEIEQKRQQVDQQLSALQIPFHYNFYADADPKEIDRLGQAKQLVKGVVIQLPHEDNASLDSVWESIFHMAAWQNMPVIVNSANENANLSKTKKAHTLLPKAIHYAEKNNTRLYIMNISQPEELKLIRTARARELLIYAETTPQHLFPADGSSADHLWEAINNRTIETIGSGYRADKPSGEQWRFKNALYDRLDPLFLLPQLLTASKEGKLSKEKLVEITRINIHEVLALPETRDFVLVDLEKEELVETTRGQKLRLSGWPAYTIVQGKVFPF